MYVSCSFCLNMWCAGFKDKLQINIKVNHGSIDVSDQYMWKMKWKSACGLKPHRPQLKHPFENQHQQALSVCTKGLSSVHHICRNLQLKLGTGILNPWLVKEVKINICHHQPKRSIKNISVKNISMNIFYPIYQIHVSMLVVNKHLLSCKGVQVSRLTKFCQYNTQYKASWASAKNKFSAHIISYIFQAYILKLIDTQKYRSRHHIVFHLLPRYNRSSQNITISRKLSKREN